MDKQYQRYTTAPQVGERGLKLSGGEKQRVAILYSLRGRFNIYFKYALNMCSDSKLPENKQ